MIRTTVLINGVDFGPIIRADSFRITHEITNEAVIVTQDYTEHVFGETDRITLAFCLHLLRENYDSGVFGLLRQKPLQVTYTDPDLGEITGNYRIDGNIEKELRAWNCVDLGNYYDSGTIRLRAVGVI